MQRDVETVAKGLSHGFTNLPHRLPLEAARVDDEQVKVRGVGLAVPRRPEQVDRFDSCWKLGGVDAVSDRVEAGSRQNRSPRS